MTKLDEIALNIELVLISIIEGVALVSLGEHAVPIMRDMHSLPEIPYVLAGLVILLVFWAQAILHAISFIRWPLRMEHMLLYFVAAFLQVIAYSTIGDLRAWFFWWTIFSIVALIIYYVDLRIIRDVRAQFSTLPSGSTFMDTIEHRHLFEMKFLVPIALAFNVVCLLLVYFMPAYFENTGAYTVLGTLQTLISLGALVDCVRNFNSRSKLLPSLF